jgi:hypothetical protein
MNVRMLLIFLGVCTALAVSSGLAYLLVSVPPPAVPAKLSVPPIPFLKSSFHGTMDGAVHLTRQVFQWHDPARGCSSVAYVDEEVAPDFKFSPLKNARVELFLSWPRKDTIIAAYSDELGSFQLGMMWAPGWYDLALLVSKNGFQPVTKVFHHGQTKHRVAVFLCKKAQ